VSASIPLDKVLGWGAVAGLAHFVVIAFLYGNPIVDALSREANQHVSVRQWPRPIDYFVRQFFGTQVEVYILTLAFFWLRPATSAPGYLGALEIGALLAALRVYPRFWNMWIQTTFPSRLLVFEVINGTLGTLFIACFLQATALR
jgi:hypothetical protein